MLWFSVVVVLPVVALAVLPATPLGWRIRCADLLNRAYEWPWPSAWEYSAALLDWAREAREEWACPLPTPREAIDADREYWEE